VSGAGPLRDRPPRVLVKRRRPCWLRPERRRRRRGDFFGRFQAGARDAGENQILESYSSESSHPLRWLACSVSRVAGEDLDAAPGTPNEPLAGRLAVFVVFHEGTFPPGTLLDDSRVFGIGTPFGAGIVCGHGLARETTRLACSKHAGVSTRPEEPVCLYHIV